MPHFFAQFRQMGNIWIRHDTRIYLSDFNDTRPAGRCLGAIVGKNPGSAKAASEDWGTLRLDGDKMLPNVRNILVQAFARAGKTPPPDAYFQVLNLFYLCGQDLAEATAALAAENNAHADPAESGSFPIVWFAWGGPSRQLDSLKDRFLSRQFAHAFYYSPVSGSVVTSIPSKTVLAKHPQGLPHEPLIAHFAALL